MNNWQAAQAVTSESVTEGHPDKVADQVSDAILDAILSKDPLARVACEVVITTGLVTVLGEISTDCYVDIPRVVRDTIREVGYNRAKYGFDAETCGVLVSLDEQSPEIKHGVDLGGAGDSGVMFGFACDDTPDLMPLPISIAHRLTKGLSDARKSRSLPYLRPDGKAQVTVAYGADGRPQAVETVVVAAQHHDEVDTEQIRDDIREQVIEPVLAGLPRTSEARYLVNPSGRFVLGGPAVDVGITGRKITVDCYGGSARHGGGCFSGKDPTKVDRAGGYGARHVAKNVVAAGLARRCEVQLAYAIGISKPVSISIETFGTESIPPDEIKQAVLRVFDLSPAGIIKRLNLRRPLYRPTAAYGHFGRTDIEAPWEDTGLRLELGREARS